MAVILEKISSLLSLWIAIGALLGIILVFLFRDRNRNGLVYFVILIILSMITWRGLIQIESARYASFLVYPAVILTIFFSSESQYLFEKKTKHNALWSLASLLLMGGFIIACLVKDIRLNPYRNCLIDGAKSMLRLNTNPQRKVILLCSSQDAGRMQHYTGIESENIDPFYDETNIKTEQAYIQRILSTGMNERESFVFISLLTASNKPEINKAPFGGNNLLRQIYSSYNDRRKKKILRIYQFVPPPASFFEKKHPIAVPLVSFEEASKNGISGETEKTGPRKEDYFPHAVQIYLMEETDRSNKEALFFLNTL